MMISKIIINEIFQFLNDIKLQKTDIQSVYMCTESNTNKSICNLNFKPYVNKQRIQKIQNYLKEHQYPHIQFIINQEQLHNSVCIYPTADKINESVVDAEKKELNPAIWDNDKLRKNVRDLIIQKVYDIGKETNLTIKNIYLTGSNLGVYYNSYTDIDIHFTVDIDSSEEVKTAVQAIIDRDFKDKYFINKHPLEFYLMDKEQEEKGNSGKLGGIYDVLADKWIVKAQKIEISREEFEQAVQIAMHYARSIDMIIGELKRDIVEYKLQDDLEDELDVEGERPSEIRQQKWREIKANTDALTLQFDAIKQLRKNSFEADFKQSDITVTDIEDGRDKSISTNNVIFKILDRYGYIILMKKFKYNIHKRMLEDVNLDQNRNQYIDEISTVLGVNND